MAGWLRDFKKRDERAADFHVVFFNHAAIFAKAGKFVAAIEKMREFLEKHPKDDGAREQAIQSIKNWKRFLCNSL